MSKLPLRDRHVVLTRPEGRGTDWKDHLMEAGASVAELPLIEISFEPDAIVLTEVLDGMGEYDWLVFTSPNGVRGFFDRFFERFPDIRSVGGVKIACVGPATEKAVRSFHLEPDLTAAQADAVSLARKLITDFNVENQKILVAAGNLSTAELPRLLMEDGLAIVDVLGSTRPKKSLSRNRRRRNSARAAPMRLSSPAPRPSNRSCTKRLRCDPRPGHVSPKPSPLGRQPRTP